MKYKHKGFMLSVSIIIIFVTIITFIIIKNISDMPYHQELKVSSIECYENAIVFLLQNNISADYIRAENIKCFEQAAFIEVELSGKLISPENEPDKTIYFLNIRGGIAAAGADTVNEVCLIIDGKTVISKIESGRDLDIISESRCEWKKKLP